MQGRYAEEIDAYKTYGANNLGTLYNLVRECKSAGELESKKQWSLAAIPLLERYVRIFPQDEIWRAPFATTLHRVGRTEAAMQAAKELGELRIGVSVFNAACMHVLLENYSLGLVRFYRSIDAGNLNVHNMWAFLESETDGVAALKALRNMKRRNG